MKTTVKVVLVASFIIVVALFLVLILVVKPPSSASGSSSAPKTKSCSRCGRGSARLDDQQPLASSSSPFPLKPHYPGILRIGVTPKGAALILQRCYPDPRLVYCPAVTEKEQQDCDFLIVYGHKTQPVYLSRDRVIALTREPVEFMEWSPAFLQWVRAKIGYYCVGKRGTLGSPFLEHPSFLPYRACSDQDAQHPKPRLMSIIASAKQQLPGHRYRHQLIKAILKRNWPIDLYGRGLEHSFPEAQQRPNFKGTMENQDDALLPYQFSLVIENTASPAYFSEKYLNCLTCHTTPLYFGARCLPRIFGPAWGWRLTGNLNQDLTLIGRVLQDPAAYRLDLTRARAALLEPGGRAHLSSLFRERLEAAPK